MCSDQHCYDNERIINILLVKTTSEFTFETNIFRCQ